MDRFAYSENVRAMNAAVTRSPVDAALAGIMALGAADLLALQSRLAGIAAKASGDRVTINIEKYAGAKT